METSASRPERPYDAAAKRLILFTCERSPPYCLGWLRRAELLLLPSDGRSGAGASGLACIKRVTIFLPALMNA
jgi:hypothetical protein